MCKAEFFKDVLNEITTFASGRDPQKASRQFSAGSKNSFFLVYSLRSVQPLFLESLGTLFGGSCPLFWLPPWRRQPCKLSPSRFPMCHPLWLSLLPRLLACSGAPDISSWHGLYSVLDLQISLREHLDICFATSRGFRLLLRTSTVFRPLLRISTVSGRQQNDETSNPCK